VALPQFAHLCHSLRMTVETGQGSMDLPWTFGDRIRKARIMVGMNQREFADAIDVAEGSLAAWETDRATPRDIVAIAKRVEMLTRIPAARLLGLTPESGPPNPPDPGGQVRHKKRKPPRISKRDDGTNQTVDQLVAA